MLNIKKAECKLNLNNVLFILTFYLYFIYSVVSLLFSVCRLMTRNLPKHQRGGKLIVLCPLATVNGVKMLF